MTSLTLSLEGEELNLGTNQFHKRLTVVFDAFFNDTVALDIELPWHPLLVAIEHKHHLLSTRVDPDLDLLMETMTFALVVQKT